MELLKAAQAVIRLVHYHFCIMILSAMQTERVRQNIPQTEIVGLIITIRVAIALSAMLFV